MADMDSILDSVKKRIGFDAGYNAFDEDLIFLINADFAVLHQLGMTETPFKIEDSGATWNDFRAEGAALEFAKEYIYLDCRITFDPPSSSFVLEALKNKKAEMEWRGNVAVDPEDW